MIALMTPMTNPTVEQEMRAFLPADLRYVVGRLVSAEASSSRRLEAYAAQLPAILEQFGAMTFDGVAFACTGSSYLMPRRSLDDIQQQVSRPILWAADCIRKELEHLGVTQLALVSPYPEDLHEAALAYWREQGIEIVAQSRIETGSRDTRAIYGLKERQAKKMIAGLKDSGAQAILLSGTGMPSVGLLHPDGNPRVISSNYCIARAMLRLTGKLDE